jgi:hypothetical protein
MTLYFEHRHLRYLVIVPLAFEPKDSTCFDLSLRAAKTPTHDSLMESFHIAFLSSEKRGWTSSPVSSKMDEMFPPEAFWAGGSPAAERARSWSTVADRKRTLKRLFLRRHLDEEVLRRVKRAGARNAELRAIVGVRGDSGRLFMIPSLWPAMPRHEYGPEG